jgi:putative N-acetyltransferase (TIGR04045 family)
MPEQVVGTVRIHRDEANVWFGSRLAVHAAFRRHGKIGATLIRLAVSSAHALGCETFLAHVQSQNVPLFRAMHWDVLAEETLLGRPHHLMQAQLDWYPPCVTPYGGFVTHTQPRGLASARSAA